MKGFNMYEHNMRRKCDFHVLSYNTLLCKKLVINMGIRLYNIMQLKLSNWKVLRIFNKN